jgi:hypothetical protein
MFTRSSKNKRLSQSGRVPAEVQAYVNRWLVIAETVLILFPLTTVAIYCANLPTAGWIAFAAAEMVSAATFLAGGLLGFLFGVPRALTSDTDKDSNDHPDRLYANTNLEQVSDWLTKIIIGATLVQLGSVANRFSELATFVSGIFGNPSTQNKTMAGAIILYSVIFGFFAAYIGARSILTFLFYLSPSDWLPERQHIQAEQSTGGAGDSGNRDV